MPNRFGGIETARIYNQSTQNITINALYPHKAAQLQLQDTDSTRILLVRKMSHKKRTASQVTAS